MDLKVEFTHKEYKNRIIAITAPMQEQMYLIKGEDKALLIDNGMGIGSLKKYVDKICDLPIIMVNTHGHPDHAGGNIEFEYAYLHPADFDLYRKMCTKEFRAGDIRGIFKESGVVFEAALLDYVDNVLPIQNGDFIDLGNRVIEIILVPGHTAGSIMLYDRNTKTLFAGDSLGIVETWIYLDYSTSLEVYYHSLEKLKEKKLDINKILSGHLPNEATADLLERKMQCIENVLAGKEKGTTCKTFAGEGLLYEYEGTGILYNPERIH